MAAKQINVRLTDEARRLLSLLIEHFSVKQLQDTGRRTTQTDVVERALRLLARKEKISEKSDIV